MFFIPETATQGSQRPSAELATITEKSYTALVLSMSFTNREEDMNRGARKKEGYAKKER